jgi:tetratricopeptide (TPR) repeat protein
MNRFPVKINNSEIQKTDDKLGFFTEIIEGSITSRCNILFEEAETFCGKECTKCFEICNEIIKLNPFYIQAYLKKIKCEKRTDRLVQLSECDDLLIKLPKYAIKIKFQKLSIIRKITDRTDIKAELTILLNELSQLTDIEIENNYIELAFGFGTLNMHDKSIECYTKFISENPKFDLAFNNRGVEFAKIGQYEKAINDFKKSIELILLSKEGDHEESLNRSKKNLLRAEGKLTSQNDDLPF